MIIPERKAQLRYSQPVDLCSPDLLMHRSYSGISVQRLCRNLVPGTLLLQEAIPISKGRNSAPGFQAEMRQLLR